MPKPSINYELAYVSLCTAFAVLDIATRIFAKNQVKLLTISNTIQELVGRAVDLDLVTSEFVTDLVNSLDEYKEEAGKSLSWDDEAEPMLSAEHAFEESLFVYMPLAMELVEQSTNSKA